MNLLVIPGSNHGTCPFCSFYASELSGFQGRPQLHLHSLGAVLLPPSTESRWSHLAGLVLRQGTQCCVNARMLSLINSALLSAQTFSLGLGHPHCLQGQHSGCWAQESDDFYVLWGVCPCSFSSAHCCLSLKMLPRKLLLGLALQARPYPPSLGNLNILGKKYSISSYQLETQSCPSFTYSHQSGCRLPHLFCSISLFSLLPSHLYWSSIWLKQVLNRSWLNERLVENGSSVKPSNKIFHSTLMV